MFTNPQVKPEISIVWHRFYGSPSQFIRTFGPCYGIYIWGDSEYEGSNFRREGCIDSIYIGQCGGGARREGEDKTGGGYKKGSLSARYRPGSYTNFPDAEDVHHFDNGKGIFWKRPKYFGKVTEEERGLILKAEAKIINTYHRWIKGKENVRLVNNNIPFQPSIMIKNFGEVPYLFQQQEVAKIS